MKVSITISISEAKHLLQEKLQADEIIIQDDNGSLLCKGLTLDRLRRFFNANNLNNKLKTIVGLRQLCEDFKTPISLADAKAAVESQERACAFFINTGSLTGFYQSLRS